MTTAELYHPLAERQVEILRAQGCTAENWSTVLGTANFTPDPIHNVHFAGQVRLGRLDGRVRNAAGLEKPSGIYQAYLVDCTVEDGARIANVKSHIANYVIGQGACVEDVGILHANAGAKFGNGIEVETLNEGGGREVTLFNHLSAQFAYLQCVVRSRPALTEKLNALAGTEAAKAANQPARIGAGAIVSSVPNIVDVQVGDHAVVRASTSLENGTILSTADAPTTLGPGVIARNFIVAEGTTVGDGAMLANTYVGQGCQVGKQFSAEGSLFFANCEAFHGEGCSVFAGPYTVTHHKSTLLIAGLFSFYNAGSGTNQSNHLYKLGPVHEGKLERGCKTGSFSYIMWPCRVGPFSVVLGKHTRTFDTRDFPFSHIEAKADGRCEMIPGLYLSTVGTVRDGAKWPSRDRRKGAVLRDLIHFQVFSPLTVGRMLRGSARLQKLSDETPRTTKTVTIDGAEVRRVLLRTGVNYYQAGIEMYLLERLVTRVEAVRAGKGNLAVDADAAFSEEWIDLVGQLMPRKRFDALCEAIEKGELSSVEALDARLRELHAGYDRDEWAWVCWAYEKVFGKAPQNLTEEELHAAAQQWKSVRTKFLNLILGDAGKEFEEVTRTGFGFGEDPSERDAEFTQVRGTFEANKFVKQIRQEIEEVARRADAI